MMIFFWGPQWCDLFINTGWLPEMERRGGTVRELWPLKAPRAPEPITLSALWLFLPSFLPSVSSFFSLFIPVLMPLWRIPLTMFFFCVFAFFISLHQWALLFLHIFFSLIILFLIWLGYNLFPSCFSFFTYNMTLSWRIISHVALGFSRL